MNTNDALDKPTQHRYESYTFSDSSNDVSEDEARKIVEMAIARCVAQFDSRRMVFLLSPAARRAAGGEGDMPYPQTMNPARRSMTPGNGCWGGDEEVTGIIIGGGGSDRYYQFWTEGGEPRLICSTHAEDDAAAVEWFKEHWPRAFKAGAEMRAFN